MTSLTQENFENLTTLWQKVGEKSGAYQAGLQYDFCAINHSDWPNRLWFREEINEHKLTAAKNELRAAATRLVIPYVDGDGRSAGELFAAQGFEQLFEQAGMSLRLTQSFDVTETIHFEQVSGKTMARLWEKVFRQAFNYKISHELLLPDYEDIRFLLAFHDGEAVGTVLLHHSPRAILGIHSMGIIPEMRGKGFAEQMMRIILNQALEQSVDWAMLQASSMGKGLYLKLGFAEQFIIKTYGLPS